MSVTGFNRRRREIAEQLEAEHKAFVTIDPELDLDTELEPTDVDPETDPIIDDDDDDLFDEDDEDNQTEIKQRKSKNAKKR